MLSSVTAQSLERIGELLSEVGSAGVFTARRTAPVDDLLLELKGLGRLRFPISRAQAEQLCKTARPARYGKGEKTLLDRRVRDTWEIPGSRVKIDRRRWNQTLLPVLGALRADLGLPDTCRLRAELHALLVYGPDQFFLPHQDTEKADDMVGTLVVMLPASFKGGAIVVEHQGQQVTYRGSKRLLSFIAFYADCRHEVRPVKEGYRIVLTYNLLLDGEAADTKTGDVEPEAATVESLASCLREYFETPLPSCRPRREKGSPLPEPPSRLVYLLDHQYTERGLAWHRLKGNDAARAAALRAAAQRRGCELVLALADVHETWSCMEPGWDEPWGEQHRYWERDEDDEWYEDDPPSDDPDAYELVDLVDWGITLDRWLDPSGKKCTPIVTNVDDREVCSTTPSSALEPYASEYEGFMGNYGNTMDRWYRRAAIVLWPRERAFAVRAEASPAWGLDMMRQRIRAGRLAEAHEMAEALLAFWETAALREERRDFFDKALYVAEGLDEPALAASVLRPFRIEELTPERASAFVALVKRYGEDWVRRLLSEWSESHAHWGRLDGRNPLDWVASLARLCEALCAADDAVGSMAARTLLLDRWRHLRETILESLRLERPSLRQEALARLPRPIHAILQSAELAEAADLRDEAVAFLCAEENEALLACLVQLLRAAAEAPTKLRASLALDTLRRHSVQLLKARLELPERAEDDWSLPLPDGCHCELCAKLDAFLSDPDQERLEWPLAKDGRKHVHRRLDAHELPVRHQTRRSGRPYTLVLSKTRAVFEREARERRDLKANLEWLTTTVTGSSPGHPSSAGKNT